MEEKLYLEGYTHDPNMPLVIFLGKLIYFTDEGTRAGFVHRHHTINEDGDMTCSKVAYYRSLGDITAIVNGYYPEKELTEEEVKEFLLDFGKNLRGHYCPDIEKRTYLITMSKRYRQADVGEEDEYGDDIEYREENKHLDTYPDLFELLEKL